MEERLLLLQESKRPTVVFGFHTPDGGTSRCLSSQRCRVSLQTPRPQNRQYDKGRKYWSRQTEGGGGERDIGNIRRGKFQVKVKKEVEDTGEIEEMCRNDGSGR